MSNSILYAWLSKQQNHSYEINSYMHKCLKLWIL